MLRAFRGDGRLCLVRAYARTRASTRACARARVRRTARRRLRCKQGSGKGGIGWWLGRGGGRSRAGGG